MGHISGEPALDRPLGGEQQQLAGHQGGFGGGANSLELRHPEELEQAKVHHSPQGGGEPPPPQAHHQQAKAAYTQATDQPFAQRCSGRWCLALIEDNLTNHVDWRLPQVTLSIAVGEDLEFHRHLSRLHHFELGCRPMGLTGSASWITVVSSLSRIAPTTNSSLLMAPTEGAMSSDVRGFIHRSRMHGLKRLWGWISPSFTTDSASGIWSPQNPCWRSSQRCRCRSRRSPGTSRGMPGG